MNILFVGDVVGAPGRRALAGGAARAVIDRHKVDFTIVNVENAAGGFGLTAELFARALEDADRRVHLGQPHLGQEGDLRHAERVGSPAAAGQLSAGQPRPRLRRCSTTAAGIPVGVLNLQGQVFMPANADSPFRVADEELARGRATSRSSSSTSTPRRPPRSRRWAGTSTAASPPSSARTPTCRPPTRRIRPGGTAYLSDVGMTGAYEGIIGFIEGPDHREVPVADAALLRDRQEGHPPLGGRRRRGRGDRKGAPIDRAGQVDRGSR